MIGLAIGGGVLLLVIILGVIFAMSGDEQDDGDNVANQDQKTDAQNPINPNVIANNPVPVRPGQKTNAGPVVQPNVVPNPGPAPKPGPQPGPNPGRKPLGSGGFQKPAQTELGKAKPASVWKLEPDPLKAIDVDWASATKLKVDSKSPRELVFGGPGSPYAAYRSDPFKPLWMVFDVRSGKQIGMGGTEDRQAGFARDKALSRDGEYFALLTDKGLYVANVKQEKLLGKLPAPKAGHWDQVRFPSDQTVTYVGQKELMTWKLPSGDLLKTISLDERPVADSLAFSPGGKYVLMAYTIFTKPGVVKVYEVATGTVAAEFEFPNEHSTCKAFSFSPDGQTLIGYFSYSGKEQIWKWDVAGGKSHGAFEIKDVFFGSSSKPIIHWFPNSKRFLLKNKHVVDLEAEGVVLALAEHPELAIVGDNHVLKVVPDEGKYAIARVELSDKDIEKAAAAVAQGGKAIDAELPELTKANIAEMGVLDLKQDVLKWAVPADPAVAGAAEWKTKIKFSPRPGNLMNFWLGNGASNRAATFYSTKTGSARPVRRPRPRPGRPVAKPAEKPDDGAPEVLGLLDVYDMSTGKSAGELQLDFEASCLAFSPSGKFALTRSEESKDRVDAFTIEDGNHVAGWRPYNELKTHETEVKGAVFIDDTHLMTLSSRDRLRLWELPACKCVYEIESVGTPVLSPSSKYVMCRNSLDVVLVESLTGKMLGKVNVGAFITGASFHHDGTRLATISPSGSNASTCRIWDVATGNMTSEFPVRGSGPALHWCGDDYLLVANRILVDTKKKGSVWSYQLPNGQHSVISPDGRHWYVAGSVGASPSFSLVGATLPEEAALAKVPEDLNTDQMVVRAGTKLSLDTTGLQTPPGQPTFTADVIAKLKANLVQNQMDLAANQNTFIKLTLSERSTGKQIEFRSFGGGGNTTVNEMSVDCSVSVVTTGKTVWESKMGFTGASFIIHRKQDESIEDYLSKQRWKSAVGFFMGVRIPSLIFKDGAGFGYGTSVLTESGPNTVGGPPPRA